MTEAVQAKSLTPPTSRQQRAQERRDYVEARRRQFEDEIATEGERPEPSKVGRGLPVKFSVGDKGDRKTWSRSKLMEFMAAQTEHVEAEVAAFIKQVDRRHDLMIADKNRILKENAQFK